MPKLQPKAKRKPASSKKLHLKRNIVIQSTLDSGEAKYRLLAETMNDIVSIVDVNTFQITYINSAIKRLTGFSSSEVIKGPHETFFADKENAKRAVLDLKKFYALARANKDFNPPLQQYKYHRKDGSTFWGEVKISFLRDSKGSITAALGITRDITERKLAEKALRDSENIYQAIFENTGTATMIIGENMLISYANSEFEHMSGYSKEEVENKMKWLDFFSKEDVEKMSRFHKKRRENPYSVPRNYEACFLNNKGEIKNVFMTVAMIPGTTNSVASLLDITARKVVEKELKASKKIFDDLLQGSPIATFIVNTDHKIIYWNKTLEQLTGFSSAQMVGTSNHWKPFYKSHKKMITDRMIEGVKPNEILKRYSAMEVEHSSDKRGIIGSMLFTNFCGQEKWLRFMMKPLRDNQGRIIGALETVEDITERRVMAQFVENRMREFQVLYQVNAHIRMIRSAKQVFGDLVKDIALACDEVKPARTYITFDGQTYTNIKRGEKFFNSIKEPIIVLGENRGEIELGYIKKISNEESFSLKQEKKVLHIVAQTIGKHMEGREVIERYQKLVNKSVVGIFILQDGKFQYVNPKFSRIFKYQTKDLIGMSHEDVLLNCSCYEALNEESCATSSNCSLKGNRKDGALIDLEIHAQRIYYYGKPAVLGMVQDVTKVVQAQERQSHFNEELRDKIAEKTRDLQKANRRLQSLNELKDEFIAVTSHELRSPLTAARGYLSFLVEDGLRDQIPEEAKDYLIRVYDNVEVLNNLVNNILDVSRIETDRLELHPVLTDISQLLQNVIKNHSFQTNEKKITIRFDDQLDKPALMKLDSVRLRQVLRNILGNAIKYSPKGKTITVGIEKRGIGIQISIEDQGMGIRKSELFDIFDKFKQGKNRQAQYSGGAGLGLFIAKKIIELHGGMIWAESTLRKGTTFRIQLPLN
ncbi:PAS domain S-box protein [Candidatus Pacearchaeota archaeon]|nr:PAS domain S-box protein [Candidatus Pacearchaeota archaeon]